MQSSNCFQHHEDPVTDRNLYILRSNGHQKELQNIFSHQTNSLQKLKQQLKKKKSVCQRQPGPILPKNMLSSDIIYRGDETNCSGFVRDNLTASCRRDNSQVLKIKNMDKKFSPVKKCDKQYKMFQDICMKMYPTSINKQKECKSFKTYSQTSNTDLNIQEDISLQTSPRSSFVPQREQRNSFDGLKNWSLKDNQHSDRFHSIFNEHAGKNKFQSMSYLAGESFQEPMNFSVPNFANYCHLIGNSQLSENISYQRNFCNNFSTNIKCSSFVENNDNGKKFNFNPVIDKSINDMDFQELIKENVEPSIGSVSSEWSSSSVNSPNDYECGVNDNSLIRYTTVEQSYFVRYEE
uniref:Uncharacterized protein n=1 Tax=Clastoptera arizonana TaxID=38151 RepID=A0A1B6E6M3_9HEMI